MINFIVYLITNSIIIFILLSYLNDKYKAKYKKRFYAILYLIFVIIISSINFLDIPILNLICNVVCFAIIDFLAYEHESIFDFYRDIIYFFLLIFLDMIAFFIVGLLYSPNETVIIFRTLSASLIVLMFNMIVRRYISFTKIENVPIREIIVYLIITIFYIFVIYILSRDYDLLKDSFSKGVIIFFVTGQIAIDVIIYYYLNFVGLSYKMEREVIEAHQQLEIKKIYYMNQKKSYEENRKIIHDFKNYIQVLENICNINRDSSNNLRNQLYTVLDKNKVKYHTSSEILDVILMDKEKEAAKAEIEFVFKMEILDISFISEIDIITIFGNLYDNAIEANKEIKKDKYIKTALYKMGEMLIIRIENSCDNQLEYVGKKIRSTKQDHSGIGLNNIKEAIKKYNGVFEIDIQNGKCFVIIGIPML